MSARATPAPSSAARMPVIAVAAAARAASTVGRPMATPRRRSATSGVTATRPVPPTTIVPPGLVGSVTWTPSGVDEDVDGGAALAEQFGARAAAPAVDEQVD